MTQQRLTERFLRYARTESQSDAAAATVPSTDSQWAFARMLVRDLTAAGATDVHLSDTCVVTAKIPGAGVGPSIGFCSHMDTVDVNLSPTLNPQVTEYTGGDLRLGSTLMRADEHPERAAYVGQTILHTDGTSVLGADDKAGVTAIMEAVAALGGQAPAGDVYVAFVPDEEIGLRGVRTIDFDRFPVDYAYTVDGGELGEVVEVTFNAATATIVIQGVSAHPMNAKGNLVNPITLGMEFASQLDPLETLEHTEGREGYIWCNHIEGNQSTCTLSLSIRDHDRAGYEEKKKRVRSLADELAHAHPRATVTCTIEDVYGNISDAKTPDNAVASQRLRAAMERLGIAIKELDMRGGTDGAWLSNQGIYTPNYFTGAHNFHSIYEFLPVPSLERCYELTLALMRGE
ncbi:peptidase T [Corynebacterium pilbarense]|uniref:Peptidase T n=1 Tax=Corynebacterium pilbarense TaxID=1288393 RepID=A0A9Q4IHV0_9CORY|nr:peptidase T [Corynebacterium pilbarense]